MPNLFVFENGNIIDKSIPLITHSETKKERRCCNYNAKVLFKIYFECNANVNRMLEVLPKLYNDKFEYPARTTLFKIIRENNFKAEFQEMMNIARKHFESEVGMSYSRINKAAEYVNIRYLQQLTGQFVGENGEAVKGKPMKVSHKDMQTLWQMQRVERGLTTSITQNTEIDSYEDELDDRIKDNGGEELMEYLKSLKNKDILDEDDRPPNIIEK